MPHPARHLGEIDLGDRHDLVTEDGDVHLAARNEALNQHLVPALEHRLDSRREGAHAPDDRPLLDSDGSVFGDRLADRRESDARDFIAAAHVAPARDRQSGAVEHSVDDVLSERKRGRPAGASGERNSKEFEHRDDHRLVYGLSINAFDEIEDQIELSPADALNPAAVIAHGHAYNLGRPIQQRALHRFDGVEQLNLGSFPEGREAVEQQGNSHRVFPCLVSVTPIRWRRALERPELRWSARGSVRDRLPVAPQRTSDNSE